MGNDSIAFTMASTESNYLTDPKRRQAALACEAEISISKIAPLPHDHQDDLQWTVISNTDMTCPPHILNTYFEYCNTNNKNT